MSDSICLIWRVRLCLHYHFSSKISVYGLGQESKPSLAPGKQISFASLAIRIVSEKFLDQCLGEGHGRGQRGAT